MNPRLRALLITIGGGIIAVGGLPYLIATIRPGVTRVELTDAGLLADCDPVTISCQGRDLCRNTLADGGLSKRYRTVRALAYQCDRPLPDGGLDTPVLIARWPMQQGRDCFEPIGPPDEACQVVEATFDDGGSPAVVADLDRCACRERGRVCRYQLADGGTPLMNFAQTYPAPFAGAGCQRKSCSEAAGEQGQSMPEECL